MNDFLQKLGFTENEAKVYEALLKIGEGTVDEINSIAKIRRPTAYSVLRGLLQKGLIAEVSGKPTRFQILPPTQTLEETYDAKIKEIKQLSKSLPIEYKRFIKKAGQQYERATTQILNNKDLTVLRGIKTLTNVIARLGKQTKNTIRVLGGMPFPSEQDIERINKEVDEVNVTPSRNLPETKFICELSMLELPGFAKLVKEASAKNVQFKTLPTIPTEIVIFDEFAALITMSKNENPDETIELLVQNSQFVKLLIFAFDTIWNIAQPILTDRGGKIPKKK